MRADRILVLAALAAAPMLAGAQAPTAAHPTAKEIDAHLRFLSSDLLEGRAPATRGGRLAAEYIASQLEASGVAPGANGSYFQSVPINIVATDQQSIHVTASGKATATLRHPDDVVVWAGSDADSSAARGELVFVGYGATAPEYKWDDYKGVDVRGKVLLVLVNDPPATASEPNLFGGRAMTYYGRWTYKYEEAERRGAAGMLIVHTTERAGYPWQVVVGSNATEHRVLPRDPKLPSPIAIRGWIKDTVAASLLSQAGLDLAQLRRQAESRDFRPVSTGIMIDASLRSRVSRLQSENVVGIVKGRDPKLSSEYVAITAHWDHLGIGPKVNGDSIYNGAYDNASGVSTVLAMARVAAASRAPKRSLLFVFVTAEESGLLGSQYFAEHPTVPVERIIADLNLDEVSVNGRFSDLEVLGSTKSSLGPTIAKLVAPALHVAPEQTPEQGHFYRSDHFSFAKVGVPSVSLKQGTEYVGHPKEWGAQQEAEFTATRYHQPSDEYRADFDLSGAAQLGETVLQIARSLGNASTVPTWNADAEFHSPRK